MRAPDAVAAKARPPIVKDRLLSIIASLYERFLAASMRMRRGAETPVHRLVILLISPLPRRGEVRRGGDNMRFPLSQPLLPIGGEEEEEIRSCARPEPLRAFLGDESGGVVDQILKSSSAALRGQPMKALVDLAIYVVPFLIIGIVAKRFLAKRIEDVDISNVREQAGAKDRPRRVSFFGRIRD
jgi:hypothetical protein